MEEELIKRILPHSDDAERSVIGCMMMNRGDYDCIRDPDRR